MFDTAKVSRVQMVEISGIKLAEGWEKVFFRFLGRGRTGEGGSQVRPQHLVMWLVQQMPCPLSVGLYTIGAYPYLTAP